MKEELEKVEILMKLGKYSLSVLKKLLDNAVMLSEIEKQKSLKDGKQ
jgi:hypothetical protein